MPVGPEDQAAIERVLDGDAEAFRFLVERHRRSVAALGRSFFRNEEDTADFVQDVFLKAYINLASFKGKSLFSTWLMRIAYNTAVNAVNRRRQYESCADEMEIEDPANPEGELIAKEARDALKTAMRELPAKYVVCLDLFFFYDFAYGEISEVTGFPVNTIKSHVFRAKRIMRERLAGTSAEA
jgi:RNA polymerase sigma-70 factor, ECF subfamily